jgi:hypothetical protein
MKKTFFGLVWSILIVGFVFISCDLDLKDYKGTAPIINHCLTSGSLGNLQSGIEKTSFRIIEDQIWFGCDTADPDKDVVSMTISMGKIGQIPNTNTIPCSSTYVNTLFYTAFFPQAGDQGTWSISAYVTDSKGNKSNTVINAVTVTD